jgi:hypothetical protein
VRDTGRPSAGRRLLGRRLDSPRTNHGRDGNGALLLLVSDASRCITGSVITVDHVHLVSSL